MSHESGHIIFPPPPKLVADTNGEVTELTVAVSFPDIDLGKFHKRLNKAAAKFFEIMNSPDE